MNIKDMSLEELEKLAEDMLANPEKYGLTKTRIHQWSLDKINEAAEMMDKIPAHLKNELADGIISAYKEKRDK